MKPMALTAAAILILAAACGEEGESSTTTPAPPAGSYACELFADSVQMVIDSATEAEATEQMADAVATVDQAGINAFAAGDDELGTALAHLAVEMETLGDSVQDVERIDRMCS